MRRSYTRVAFSRGHISWARYDVTTLTAGAGVQKKKKKKKKRETERYRDRDRDRQTDKQKGPQTDIQSE